MRLLLTALAALLPLAAQAASPQESYLTSRNRSIAEFKRLEDANKVNDAASKREERARDDLANKLRAVVGAVAVDGFAGPGKLSLESLYPSDIGAEQLDGLVYSGADDSRLLVTTVPLAETWLRARRTSWPQGTTAPQKLDQALKSEDFYTLAISPDAAVFRFAELPIGMPAGARLAFAMLDLRAQDETGTALPNEIIVSVVRDGELFVANTPAKARISQVPACEQVWRDYDAKSKAAEAAYQASNPKDEKLFERSSKLQEEGSKAFRRCFAERANGEAFFAEVTKQAQALVDRMK
jgi:hypothetical protein